MRQNRLTVIRHGQTEWSNAGRHTSVTDIDITGVGIEGATALRQKLGAQNFAVVLVSPRLRARHTADLAGFHDRAMVEPDLAEWNYGNDEGRTTAEITADRPDWNLWRDDPMGGETNGEVSARVDRVIDRVANIDGDVLAFAHGHVLDILAARWLGLDGRLGRLFKLDPTTISILSWHHGLRVLECWNAPVD